MKGIEISKAYYLEYGKKMLEEKFSDIMKYLAVGFTGSGSERYGYDDEVSRDHDFEAGFSIFLPDSSLIDSKVEFKLERAYYKLPKEFMGVKREIVSAVGGNRNGVIRTADFFQDKVGNGKGDLTVLEWLSIPDYFLSEAVNGEIFYDGFGEITSIRNKLMNMPKDVLYKRIAGNLLTMFESGQYNFSRCIRHGEKEGAKFSLNEFVKSAIKVLYYINGKYSPYYKWAFKGLKDLEKGKELYSDLSEIFLSDLKCENEIKKVSVKIEDVSAKIVEILKQKNITKISDSDLSKQAYIINDKIEDHEIRNMNILASV